MTKTKIKEIIETEIEDLQDGITFLRGCFEASKRCINNYADKKEFEEKLRHLRTELYDLTVYKTKTSETLVIFIISMQIDNELALVDTNIYINKVMILKEAYMCLGNEIADLIGITKNDKERRGFNNEKN